MKIRLFGLALLTLIPTVALATSTTFFGPIVPPCTEGGDGLCQACNLVQLADNLLKLFVSLGVMAAAIMFAYAGFLYTTAAANKQNLDSAKKIFWNVLIGLIFILAAFLIVDLILRTLTNQSFNVLTRVQCVQRETTAGSIGTTFTEVEDNPTQGPGGVNPPGEVAASGEYCSGANWSQYEDQFRTAVRANPNVANITAADIADFCPNYSSLSSSQKEDVAVRLFSSMSRYESGCNPEANSVEPRSSFPNNDPLTGQPVRSEGLCQLSYQDEQGYKKSDGTCDFDYASKDIRDPTKNINCCVYILSRQLTNQNTIAASGSYWSILRSGQYTKLSQIRAAVRSVPGCI